MPPRVAAVTQAVGAASIIAAVALDRATVSVAAGKCTARQRGGCESEGDCQNRQELVRHRVFFSLWLAPDPVKLPVNVGHIWTWLTIACAELAELACDCAMRPRSSENMHQPSLNEWRSGSCEAGCGPQRRARPTDRLNASLIREQRATEARSKATGRVERPCRR
jgi:hypothetical protein